MNGSCCSFSVPQLSKCTELLSFAKLPAFPQAAQHSETVPPTTQQTPTGWVFSGAPLHWLVRFRKFPLMVYGNGITNRWTAFIVGFCCF